MERRRLRDGLVGAATALAVVLVAGAGLLWWATDPAGDPANDPAGDPAASSSAAPVPGGGASPEPRPPADLADDETWLGDLTLEAGAVVTAGSRLRDVRAVGRDVRAGAGGLVAGVLAVEATVPFEAVAAELGAGTTVRAAGDGQATVRRTVEIAGRELDVVATGTVEVVGGRLVMRPRSVDVGGPGLLSGAISAVARRLVTIEQEVEGLPEGLVLRDVTVQDDGFRAELDGRRVRLVP